MNKNNKLIRKIETDVTKLNVRADEFIPGKDVPAAKVREVIKALKQRMDIDDSIVCLTASQIGEPLRLFVTKNSSKQYIQKYATIVSPLILKLSKDCHCVVETNASFPGKHFINVRSNEITITYLDETNVATTATFKGPFADVIQQYVYMLDGLTPNILGLDLDDIGGYDEFNNASKEEQLEVLKMYLSKDLPERCKYYDGLIEKDKGAKDLATVIDAASQLASMQITYLDENKNPLPIADYDDMVVKALNKYSDKKVRDEYKKTHPQE